VPTQRHLGYSIHADPAAFGLADRPADAPAYEPPPLKTELQVTTQLDDVRIATQRVAASAQRLLSICTTDMEPPVYDQTYFMEVAKRLILGNPFGRIRVLVRDQGRMNSVTNRFVSMARRLSHSIDIRAQPDSMGRRPVSYCFSDTGSMIFRARADRWDGVTAQRNPQHMQRLLDEFEAGWREAEAHMRLHSGYR
jgi:hypothetical protein